MAKKKPILNPKRPTPTKEPVITQEEQEFIAGVEVGEEEDKPVVKKEKNKGYPISMSPTFYNDVKAFCEEFPEQGTMSSVFVRGAALLMKAAKQDN